MMKSYITEFMAKVKEYEAETIAIRRELHELAEQSGKEFQTTAYIKEKLSSYGVEVISEGFETGLLARVYGCEEGKHICIRADIDALPLKEESSLPFSSKSEKACHCCGHDLHIAAAITCARILRETADYWKGSAAFIFQPLEETGKGAKYMIQQGALDILKPDAVLGFHCWPELPAGQVGVRRGAMMAASDSIRIHIYGNGGHAAHPHKCVDPILISSYIIQQLQNIVSRECSPISSAVITIGKITGGTADNSIPSQVTLEGTSRSLLPSDREKIRASIERIVEYTAKAMGGSGKAEIIEDGDPLICDEKIVDVIEEAAKKVLDLPIVELKEPSMGMEDFAYYLKDLPGAYFRVGTGNENPASKLPLHNPGIIFDESAIMTMCKVLLQFIDEYRTV